MVFRIVIGAFILSFLALWLMRSRPAIQARNGKLCDELVNSLQQNKIEQKTGKVQDCMAKHLPNNSMEELDGCEFFSQFSSLKTETDIRNFCFSSSKSDIETQINQCLEAAGLSKEEFARFSMCIDS